MAVLLELADVGAGDERLAAGAAHDHDAHRIVVAQGRQRFAKSLPHLQRHRVALLGVVEGDHTDAVGDLREDLAVGVGRFMGEIGHRALAFR